MERNFQRGRRVCVQCIKLLLTQAAETIGKRTMHLFSFCLSVHVQLSGILSQGLTELACSSVEITTPLGILWFPKIFTFSLLLRHGEKIAPEILFPPS